MGDKPDRPAKCGNCSNYYRGYCEYFDRHMITNSDGCCRQYCGHGTLPDHLKGE